MIIGHGVAQHKLRQPKMSQMKIFPALLAAVMLLGCKTHEDRFLESRVEYRVIQNLLQGFAQDKAKDENIAIIIGYQETGYLVQTSCRPANYIAYFKYRHDDESIVVHYHLFPVREKYSDEFYSNDTRAFTSFLEKFATGSSAAFFDGAKQMGMPLPPGLKNDSMVLEARKKKGKTVISLDASSVHYWGFRLINKIMIQKFGNYGDYTKELSKLLFLDILEPFEARLVNHETPAEWFAEYEKEYGPQEDLEKRIKDLEKMKNDDF